MAKLIMTENAKRLIKGILKKYYWGLVINDVYKHYQVSLSSRVD